MKISKELLKKYALGKCTPAEKMMVEEWLVSDNHSDAMKHVHLFEPSREKVWGKIRNRIAPNSSRTIKISGQISRVAAAACIAIVSFGAGYFYFEAYKSDRLTTEANPLENVKYMATPNSKIVQLAETPNGKSSLHFDGELVIINQGSTDKEVELALASYDAPNATKKVIVRKGHKYAVFHFKHKRDELMVFDLDNFRCEVSPVLRHKIQKSKDVFKL